MATFVSCFSLRLAFKDIKNMHITESIKFGKARLRKSGYQRESQYCTGLNFTKGRPNASYQYDIQLATDLVPKAEKRFMEKNWSKRWLGTYCSLPPHRQKGKKD